MVAIFLAVPYWKGKYISKPVKKAKEDVYKRQTLWNAVENCEKHQKAQLAYSFDIAMQNELTLEENMELARKFCLLYTSRCV